MEFEQADALNGAIRTIAMRHRALATVLLAPLGLHPGQEVILLELDARGPRTQGQLAVASGCEPPTITGSVRKLETAGLVVRTTSPTDGRVTIVDLSDRGRELLPALRSTWQELADRTAAGLSMPAEKFAAVLGELARSLGSERP
ncbi:MAG TPA: MarR family winged helix-turn-helix transcriptional regulator [Blastococcus sp.]|nr:MarR family winged helix-turn-helix transcriptional regulator [Blastococcus sp.]